MRRTLAALTSALLTLAPLTAGCSPSPGDDMSTPTALPTSPGPSPELLCGMVPLEAARTALGAEDVSGRGEVRRDPADGTVLPGRCSVVAGGSDGSDGRLSVDLQYNTGGYRADFDRGLTDGRLAQLPEDGPLGYTFADGDGGVAVVSVGNYLLTARVPPVDDRDAQDDAAALAQQVAVALDLPDTWDLRGGGPSPSRPAS